MSLLWSVSVGSPAELVSSQQPSLPVTGALDPPVSGVLHEPQNPVVLPLSQNAASLSPLPNPAALAAIAQFLQSAQGLDVSEANLNFLLFIC